MRTDRWGLSLLAVLALCAACRPSPAQVGPDGPPVVLLPPMLPEPESTSAGDLVMIACRQVDASLVCTPWRTTIDRDDQVRPITARLPDVVQPIRHSIADDALIGFPGIVGSTADPASRKVYWHADCDSGYHVTDPQTGATKTFALDPASLGLPAGSELCLGEWVFDETRRTAIALAGRLELGTFRRSHVELVLALDAAGNARVLHRLGGRVDPSLVFLHPFQTIASLDPDRDEVIAPLLNASTGVEAQLRLNLGTGAVEVLAAGGARVHRYFDLATRRQMAFQLSPTPGYVAGDAVAAPSELDLAAEVSARGISGFWFMGAGYDSRRLRHHVVLKKGDDTRERLLLGVTDSKAGRFLGFVDLDLTLVSLGFPAAGPKRLFLATEFIPAKAIGGDLGTAIRGSFDGKLERYSSGQPFSGVEAHAWDDVAWRGDRIFKQLLLWSGAAQDVRGLHYEISDLVGGAARIPAVNLRLRHARYVKGDPEPRGCSGYPTHPTFVEVADALAVRKPAVLTKTDPVKLWASLDVPQSTPPGDYTGSIRVTDGAANALTFTVRVKVVDRVLPPVSDWRFHLDLWQYPNQALKRHNAVHPEDPIGIWSPRHFALLEPSYRLLADTGQKAITAHIKDGALGGPSMIRWIRKADGTWTYDFSAFDTFVQSMRAWGAGPQISCFSMVGWNPDTIPFFDETTGSPDALSAAVGSPLFAQRWSHFLAAFKAHLDAKGWFDQTVLYMDEVDETRMVDVRSVVSSTNAGWKMGLALFSPAVTPATRNSMFDLSRAFPLPSAPTNPVSTFYTSCLPTAPNTFVTPGNSPAEVTWLAWHAAKEHEHGYLRWAYDLWTTSDPFDVRDEGNTAGDFSMAYFVVDAERAEAMSSVRLELLRDGIQDFERLAVLRATLAPQKLTALEQVVDRFSMESGRSPEALVLEAQQVMKDTVTTP